MNFLKSIGLGVLEILGFMWRMLDYRGILFWGVLGCVFFGFVWLFVYFWALFIGGFRKDLG